MMRAAGCVVNDWWDRDLDKKVERCKTRPIAAGEISTAQAALFFGFNCIPIVCTYVMGGTAVRQVIHYFVPLMVTYPLFKRVTYWPQVVLGFTFNIGLLGIYTYMTNRIDPAALCFYFGGASWTLVYDSIYAYQDRKDDTSAGVKSTALLWGDNYKTYASVFMGLSTVLWTAGGYLALLGPGYYLGMCTALGHIAWQVWTVDINNMKDCGKKFDANKYTGMILLGAIVLGKVTAGSTKS
jgi:4-hydroxybenzoate polyprenyl transferase